jgi:leucyl/phenylalanyl-tRNA--protein transferase
VSVDEAFSDVVRACAAPRDDEGGTWLIPEMQAAYQAMHEAGLAHSVEVWREGRLVGGLYGVALGRMFFGESMMSREPDGSKIALARIAAQMLEWDMPVIDCQMATPHLASLGARAVPRRVFTTWVATLVRQPGPTRWRIDAALDPMTRLGAASMAPASD